MHLFQSLLSDLGGSEFSFELDDDKAINLSTVIATTSPEREGHVQYPGRDRDSFGGQEGTAINRELFGRFSRGSVL
jgi:hypothetical protein